MPATIVLGEVVTTEEPEIIEATTVLEDNFDSEVDQVDDEETEQTTKFDHFPVTSTTTARTSSKKTTTLLPTTVSSPSTTSWFEDSSETSSAKTFETTTSSGDDLATSTKGSIELAIPANITVEDAQRLRLQLESLITKIVDDYTTTTPLPNEEEDEAVEEATEPIVSNDEAFGQDETGEDDVLQETATALNLDLPTISDDLDAEELEQKLRELVAQVTERLELADTTELGLEDATEAVSTADASVPRAFDTGSRDENSLDTSGACKSTEFQCTTRNECIPRSQRCNGMFDCVDASDEDGCETAQCLPGEFQCPAETGHCLSLDYRCDGNPDCQDGEDEMNCPLEAIEGECEFRCEAEQRCIQKSFVCNGVSDCYSGEDEVDCNCAVDEFKCSLGGGCVMASKICDGHSDCADGSDEWDCFLLNNGSLLAR